MTWVRLFPGQIFCPMSSLLSNRSSNLLTAWHVWTNCSLLTSECWQECEGIVIVRVSESESTVRSLSTSRDGSVGVKYKSTIFSANDLLSDLKWFSAKQFFTRISWNQNKNISAVHFLLQNHPTLRKHCLVTSHEH